MRMTLLFVFMMIAASPCRSEVRKTDQVQWKLFFNQMFALELRKEFINKPDGDRLWQEALKKYTAYSPHTFNEIITETLKASTSSEAYAIRQSLLDNPESYRRISKLNFSESVPLGIQANPAVGRYLKGIASQQSREIQGDENFFSSPEAGLMMEALSYARGRAKAQKVVMVMVPGYAAHTIKFGIFPEMVGDVNLSWGRDISRPILDDGNGIDRTYEDFKTFYGKSKTGPGPFDIIIPAGWEMGNTVGLNSETSDLLAQWIRGLPASYADTKLLLLGYSKGAPIIFEMLKRHPELKSRVLGIVTYGGVIQGTHVARSGGKQIREYLGKRSIAEMIDTIRNKGLKSSLDSIAPFFSSFELGFVKIPVIREIMELFDIDTSLVETQVDRFLDGREVRELLDGVDDLSPMVRTAWNLRNFDNELLDPGTFIFNLSAITDISQFASRLAANNQRQRTHALISPTLKDDGKLDWSSLGLDSWFLYLSSLEGFKQAPGGLYDTQVDLQHGKTPWLDSSPLSASLTAEELSSLWSQPDIQSRMISQGISTLEQFSQTPRSQLLKRQTWNHINAYDLGEFKGHHWSLFHQAFRAPPEISEQYTIWEFPRKAFMRALLQTVALYNVIQQNP